MAAPRYVDDRVGGAMTFAERAAAVARLAPRIVFDGEGAPAESLLKALADEESARRALAADVLGQRGRQPRDALLKLLADPKGSVRLRAALALAPHKEARAVDTLIDLLPTLPTRLFISDDSLALLPMRSRGQARSAGALLVNPGGLLDLVMAIFEVYWSNATDFLSNDAASEIIDELDGDLIKLLLLGLTDATVATQLRISVRTVQRRIAEMMEKAGVTTRIQLGAEAVRRAWV